jgi:predicted nucleic acid-binding protein
MQDVLVDSSVVLDVFLDDPEWGDWSEAVLSKLSETRSLIINPMIYTEISIGFERIEELEKAVEECGLKMVPIPREALFLAGKVYLRYRKGKGKKVAPLPDFFIGAHAAVEGLELVTRDVRRIKTYFPSVKIISPYRSK